jgi:hypothetical protein
MTARSCFIARHRQLQSRGNRAGGPLIGPALCISLKGFCPVRYPLHLPQTMPGGLSTAAYQQAPHPCLGSIHTFLEVVDLHPSPCIYQEQSQLPPQSSFAVSPTPPLGKFSHYSWQYSHTLFWNNSHSFWESVTLTPALASTMNSARWLLDSSLAVSPLARSSRLPLWTLVSIPAVSKSLKRRSESWATPSR